jgi:electron transfer flavoprotein beta subunit
VMAAKATNLGIRVKRELENGWFQNVEMPLPAVLTIQSGINKLRYATLMGIKKAKTKEVKRLTVAELGVAPSPAVSIERIYPPPRSKQTQLLDGNAKEAAAKLIEKLRFEARVL